MGKAQSKRSVDITTETKKGAEDEITEKMEKIEDLDKKEVINGDATISEKSDPEKKETEEVENDKDMTTEKEVDLQASGDSAEPQNAAETSKDEGGPGTAEEISPLADESIKKSKKEKVKKKWSFRSISFGKKDKQKPAKNDDAAEEGSAATNGADIEEKTITEPEDTQKDKYSKENEEKTAKSHENGNATPEEINNVEKNENKASEEKSIDITAKTTNNTTTTETSETVQNEIDAVSSELSEKTENTAVVNETKISENATVDDVSKNGNETDKKNILTEDEQQKTDATKTFVEAPSEKRTTLASAMTNESSASTNGEVVEEIHQNGDHGESEQEVVEKSKAQIEVNSKTDNTVSAATLDSISSTFINPFNVQIHVQDLNESSENSDKVVQINNDGSDIQKSTDVKINNEIVAQSFISESISLVEDIAGVQGEAVSDLTSNKIDDKELCEQKLGVEPSPPPLPISPPPSQVSVFAFTNNDGSVEDSVQTNNSIPITKDKDEKNTISQPLNELPIPELEKSTDAISNKNFCEKTSQGQSLQTHVEVIKNIETEFKDKNEAEVCVDLLEQSQIEEDTSIAVATEVIDEITEKAAEIVNEQLQCNEKQIVDKKTLHSSETIHNEKEKRKNDGILNEMFNESSDNNAQLKKDQYDDKEFECEVENSSKECPLVLEQTSNITTESSLDLTEPDTIQHDQDEMISIYKSDNLDEHLGLPKEFATAKDIKDNVTVAEITQDLSVTCE